MAKNDNIKNLNKAVEDCTSVEELKALVFELPAEVKKQLHRDVVDKVRKLKKGK